VPASAAAPAPVAAGAAAPAPAGAVTSPMVGTAYLASEPGGAPFVKIGDRVKQGQTLLIIEAMKVMNPIPAPEAGTVDAILVNDGQPVEYGEPLLVLR
jgi:acetyl-CoA carboxylase biotin carboxyl carrier protein